VGLPDGGEGPANAGGRRRKPDVMMKAVADFPTTAK